MMRQKWLLLDANYVAWRAFYSMRTTNLTSKEQNTEVIFGFLRDMVHFQEVHNTDRIVFCFDRKPTKRLELCPTYKANRTELPPGKERDRKQAARKQIRLLRNKILKDAGYKNVFSQKGYEADDIIAALSKSTPHRFVIISADDDLLQLLSKRTKIWRPRTRETITRADFKRRYGIKPAQWADVKAIAGCGSDNVQGVKGVGELTALKYVRGDLPHHSAAYKSIQQSSQLIETNRKLVKLPFDDRMEEFELKDDTKTRGGWASVLKKYELNSLKRDRRG